MSEMYESAKRIATSIDGLGLAIFFGLVIGGCFAGN